MDCIGLDNALATAASDAQVIAPAGELIDRIERVADHTQFLERNRNEGKDMRQKSTGKTTLFAAAALMAFVTLIVLAKSGGLDAIGEILLSPLRSA